MAFSISNFRSEISYGGVLKTNHSQVLFAAPRGLRSEYANIQNILLRCESSIIPGVSITYEDVRRYGYGRIDKAPSTPLFDPFQCQFIVDAYGETYKFFYDWMSFVVNFNSSKSIGTENKYGALPYEMSYRSDYVTDLFVLVYDVTTDKVLEYQLLNAYPQQMQETPMSWGDENSIVRLGMVFQYSEWNMRVSSKKNLEGVFNDILSFTSPKNIQGTLNNIAINVPRRIMDDLKLL